MNPESASEHGAIPAVTLGWRLQMALAKAGMSVQEMADELGMARSSLSRWMNEHGAPPRRLYLLQWAMRTGVDADWLIEGRYPVGVTPTEPAVECPQPGSNRRPAD